MSKFIRTIGRCAVNSISFDVYENKNGTASIRPCKNGQDFPKRFYEAFESLELLDEWIESINHNNLSGAALVQFLKDGPFSRHQKWL